MLVHYNTIITFQYTHIMQLIQRKMSTLLPVGEMSWCIPRSASIYIRISVPKLDIGSKHLSLLCECATLSYVFQAIIFQHGETPIKCFIRELSVINT